MQTHGRCPLPWFWIPKAHRHPAPASPACVGSLKVLLVCALKDGKVLGFVRPPSVTTAAKKSNGQCLQSSLLALKVKQCAFPHVQHLFCTNSCGRFTVTHGIKSYLFFGPGSTSSSRPFVTLCIRHNAICICRDT